MKCNHAATAAIHLWAVNCVANSAVCSQLNIQGYPTIIALQPSVTSSSSNLRRSEKASFWKETRLTGSEAAVLGFLQDALQLRVNALQVSSKAAVAAEGRKEAGRPSPSQHWHDALASLSYLMRSQLPANMTQSGVRALTELLEVVAAGLPSREVGIPTIPNAGQGAVRRAS
eukprot:CAMPEP_0170072444 /NCGR_PEP_ID=MMETSP0019_2-20121128/10087_1 /TAXON_ID=98059 /ORGANISM="Dinobryon sp., Strain UTEXLB2267" /LENGTH=171 /DNA_ID=CAMNT_0010281431 /DNA_START=924 /DNA_END=1438 /DNA_ORIENTATION=+